MGPAGPLPPSIPNSLMVAPLAAGKTLHRTVRTGGRTGVLAHDAAHGHDREGQVADEDDQGEHGGERPARRVEAGVVEPEALEEAPGPGVEVHRQGYVGDDV